LLYNWLTFQLLMWLIFALLVTLTSAIIEAGNIAIGMIRKRARGIQDTEYFKLKIRQSSLKDDSSMFYAQHPFLLT